MQHTESLDQGVVVAQLIEPSDRAGDGCVRAMAANPVKLDPHLLAVTFDENHDPLK